MLNTSKKFAEAVAEGLNLRGVESQVKVVVKNNGLETVQVCLMMEDGLCPSVRIDGYLDKGMSEIETVDDIIKRIPDFRNDFSMDDVRPNLEWENAKDKIIPAILNLSLNENAYRDNELLYRPIPGLDLMIAPKLVFRNNGEECASAKIPRRLFEWWNVSEDELYAQAEKNLLEKGYSFTSIARYLSQKIGFPEIPVPSEDDCPLWVATVGYEPGAIGGAAVLLNKEALKDFSERTNGDFIILPSSVDEVLFVSTPVTTDCSEFEFFKDMVKTVNSENVPSESVLLDGILIYRAETGKLEMKL